VVALMALFAHHDAARLPAPGRRIAGAGSEEGGVARRRPKDSAKVATTAGLSVRRTGQSIGQSMLAVRGGLRRL
jgi:hypothetical protein